MPKSPKPPVKTGRQTLTPTYLLSRPLKRAPDTLSPRKGHNRPNARPSGGRPLRFPGRTGGR